MYIFYKIDIVRKFYLLLVKGFIILIKFMFYCYNRKQFLKYYIYGITNSFCYKYILVWKCYFFMVRKLKI